MGNRNHDGESKLLFWIETKMLEELDKIIEEHGYKSRAEWMRAQIRAEIGKFKAGQPGKGENGKKETG